MAVEKLTAHSSSVRPMKPFRHFVIFPALAALTVTSFAALPPKYLEVKAFDKCLAEQQQSGFQTWCLPAKKAAACPATSWKQLRALKGPDAVPHCAKKAQP